MSYLFDSSADELVGTFSSTYADPVTLACFVKMPNHSITSDYAVSLGNSSSSIDQSYCVQTNSVDDQWLAVSRTTTNTNANVTLNIDNIWVGIVGVFTNDSLRDLYIQSISNTGQGTGTRAVADVLQFIAIGRSLAGTGALAANIAEIAIWNSALSVGNVTSYLAGTAASSIAAASLIGYWPLSAADLTNQGTDAGGDLTANSATFDADHPIITFGGLQMPGRRIYVM